MPIARFWASIAAALLFAAPISAQEESVHLEYDASAGCPDRAAFVAEITARTTRARFVNDARDVRTFTATIRTQGERSVGSLISNSGQIGAERRVSGKTCPEVVSALALITALAIDPSASTRPSPSAPPENPPAPNPKAADLPNATGKSTTTLVSASDRNNGPPTTSSWGLSVGAEGEGSYGFTSVGALTMLGGSVYVETGPFVHERRGPLFRLGAMLLRSPTIEPDSKDLLGQATFTLAGARLSCSPLYIRISGPIELHPWLIAEVGGLIGNGIPGGLVTSTDNKTVPWIAVGEGLEARWTLGDHFWLALDLRAAEPLYPKRFVFKSWPNNPITSVPFFEGILGVGIGGRIL